MSGCATRWRRCAGGGRGGGRRRGGKTRRTTRNSLRGHGAIKEASERYCSAKKSNSMIRLESYLKCSHKMLIDCACLLAGCSVGCFARPSSSTPSATSRATTTSRLHFLAISCNFLQFLAIHCNFLQLLGPPNVAPLLGEADIDRPAGKPNFH